MQKYWESLFKEEGALWKFEPSDSAILAINLFKANGIKNIIIPGIGYGRNAKLFLDYGFKVTGIEISKSAIDIAKANRLDCEIHNGSVTLMPYDDELYGGIYCYALIHLLSKPKRKKFLRSCYNQLKKGGIMIFIVAPTENNLYGNGKLISKNRYKIPGGFSVYFYNSDSIEKEFTEFGLTEFTDIDEPVKFMEGHEPMKFKFVICKKC